MVRESFGIEQFGGNERAKDQFVDARKDGYHHDNLFDQNEDQSGEKIDLRTGEPIKNDADIEAIGIDTVGEESILGSEKMLKEEFEDATEKWLRENYPDYLGLGKVKKPQAPVETFPKEHKRAA